MAVLACFSYLSASAYDFEADGLYFTIISPKDLTVSVDGAVNKDTDKVVIPQTVVYKNKTLTITRVGSEAFMGYKNLQSVSFPNTVLSIGESAFEEDELLADVVLPDSLLEIEIKSTTPPVMLNGTHIPNKVYTDVTLYVPKGCKDAYSNDPDWGSFWDIREYEDDCNTEVTNVTDNLKDIAITTQNGSIIVSNAPHNTLVMSIIYRVH